MNRMRAEVLVAGYLGQLPCVGVRRCVRTV